MKIMSTHIVALGAVLAGVIGLTSCLNSAIKISNPEHNVRKNLKCTSVFSGVRNNGYVDVIYKIGPTSVSLDAPSELLDHIHISVADSCLVIDADTKGITIMGNYKATITVSSPSVSNINIFGSGDFELASPISSNSPLKIESQGSGDVKIGNASISSLQLNLLGSGDFEASCLNVRTESQLVTKGSGDINIESIKGSTIKAITEGSGNITFNTITSPEICLISYGSGDISLPSSAGVVNSQCMGSGIITYTKQ